MPAQFFHFKIEPFTSEQRRDLSAQSHARRVRLLRRITQDVAHFLFHAAAVLFRTALQPGFHTLLDISNQKLRQVGTSHQVISRYHLVSMASTELAQHDDRTQCEACPLASTNCCTGATTISRSPATGFFACSMTAICWAFQRSGSACPLSR